MRPASWPPRPEAIETYCRPLCVNVIGVALTLDPVLNCQSGAPLLAPQEAHGEEGEVVEAPGPQPGEIDPLVSNGLGSPLCRGVLGAGELAADHRRQ